ncbi:hypothetical protein ACFVAJ_17395 [Agromyces sp. NPDC057679]|uniref:hypothetical protein n=1 Tax=Agromyces sp. NPDC057679 TaxID=3346207 RepID=UPI00366CEEB6
MPGYDTLSGDFGTPGIVAVLVGVGIVLLVGWLLQRRGRVTRRVGEERQPESSGEQQVRNEVPQVAPAPAAEPRDILSEDPENWTDDDYSDYYAAWEMDNRDRFASTAEARFCRAYEFEPNYALADPYGQIAGASEEGLALVEEGDSMVLLRMNSDADQWQLELRSYDRTDPTITVLEQRIDETVDVAPGEAGAGDLAAAVSSALVALYSRPAPAPSYPYLAAAVAWGAIIEEASVTIEAMDLIQDGVVFGREGFFVPDTLRPSVERLMASGDVTDGEAALLQEWL